MMPVLERCVLQGFTTSTVPRIADGSFSACKQDEHQVNDGIQKTSKNSVYSVEDALRLVLLLENLVG